MSCKLSEHERIRMDFLKAIERISLGFPENEKLKKLKNINRLRLNFTNVALEAGRSRTLIAMDDTKYSDIREIILRGEKYRVKAESTTDVIQRLRDEVKELEKKILKIREAQARDFYALNDAINDARRWRDAYRRLKDERINDAQVKVLSINNINRQ